MFINQTELMVAFLTPILLAAGYFYRLSRESKGNQKKALYILMEIWHRMSVFYRSDFDDFFEKIYSKINESYPSGGVPQDDLLAIKGYFEPILFELVRETALSDLDAFEDKYHDVVSLISVNDPIFAYEINSVHSIKKFIGFIDSYIEKSLNPIEENDEENKAFYQGVKGKMSEKARMDSVQDLEKLIRSLSWKIGIGTYISCVRVIKKRKLDLLEVNETQLNEMFTSILVPLIEQHTSKEQLRQPASDS